MNPDKNSPYPHPPSLAHHPERSEGSTETARHLRPRGSFAALRMTLRIFFAPAVLFVAIPVLARAEAKTYELAAETAFTPERGHGFDLGTAPNAAGKPFYFSTAVPEGT